MIPISSSLLGTARNVLWQLPRKLKRGLILISVLMTATATLETLTLGTLAVLISALTDGETVLRSQYLVPVKSILAEFHFWQTPRSLVISLCIILVVLVVIKNCMLAANSYFSTLLSARVETHYGTRLLRGMLFKGYPWHLKHNSADLIQTVAWRYFLGRGYFVPMLQLVSDSILITFMLTALFIIQPGPTFAVLVVLTSLGTLLYRQIRRSLDKIAKLCTQHELSINKSTTMALQGIKDVKIYNKEIDFLGNFVGEASLLSTSLGMRNFYSGLSVWVLEALGLSLMAGGILLLMLGGGASMAKITGMLSLFAISAWRALPAANRIIGSLTSMRGIMSYINHTLSYLNQFPTEVSPPSDLGHGQQTFHDLELSDLTFAYSSSDSDSLQGINLHLRNGKMLGIVGHSGAGKSTLADILIGLLEPSGGTIKVNGNALDRKAFSNWSRCIGYVPQSPYICDGTVAANVAFGVDEAAIDKDTVLLCCQLAAMDFLADLPQGVDTVIGERGLRLSGGQRQRVAIARALYYQPQLLLLDEATSSLDRQNEDAILQTVYSLRGRMTMVIVAHRLSTVERCDTIMWMEKGRVRMIGSPEDVLPEYAKSMSGDENPEVPSADNDGAR